jgi:hypothetical protein
MKSTVIRQETPSIQSLDRGLVILETVAPSTEPVSLGELTGAPSANFRRGLRV